MAKDVVEVRINKEKLLEAYTSITKLYLLVNSHSRDYSKPETRSLKTLVYNKELIYDLIFETKSKVEDLLITSEDILEITTA